MGAGFLSCSAYLAASAVRSLTAEFAENSRNAQEQGLAASRTSSVTVESLKTIFDWGAVILLFLTFAFGAGVLITGNIINSRQSERLRQFDRDLTEAKTELGKQQERAAKAEQDAFDAKTTAAEAEKSLLELQARLADRNLSAQQRGGLVGQLGPWAGVDVDVLVWGDSPEVEIISGQILESLTKAGWHLHTGHAGGGGGAVRGILVGTRSDANSNIVLGAKMLISALQAAGLVCGPWKFEDMATPTVMVNTSFTGKAPIRLFIGSKPPK